MNDLGRSVKGMGTLLFIFAVIAEVAFVILCLRTKSNQTRAKAFVRLGAVAGFALLVILKAVDWGLRYYALAALLLLLAAFGAADILRKRQATTAVKPRRVVLRAIAMTLLFFVVTLPAIIFPRHSPVATTGPYQVLTANATYLDTSRIETFTSTGEARKVNVGFWYPAADGKFPLIVFSHGAISQVGSNISLFRELASHGYVVASVSHPYHALFSADEDGRMTWIDRGYLHEVMAEDAKNDKEQSFQYYQAWMKLRMDDLSFVIDHIRSEARNENAAAIYRLVDTAAIGVMGHSLGGSAALGIGRTRSDVGAVIALESPFMYDIQGVQNGEFRFTDKVYPVPVLNVYSDSAWSRLGALPQYAENYALLSGTNAMAFNVHISGVGHLSLTDLSLASPALTRILNGFRSTKDAKDCLRTINEASLAFFDAYLKQTGQFTVSGS